MRIPRLEKLIKESESLLESNEKEYLLSKSFALSLSISSLQSHIEELQFNLKQEKEKRCKEVVEIRLIGDEVNDGSVPLDVLGKLASSFSSLISSTSARLTTGIDPKGSISKDVKHLLNLRFADLKLGSSRLYISGDSSPDMFGYSLLENSLDGLFQLLGSDLNDSLSEKVEFLGIRSVHNLSEFLKVLRINHIQVDLKWDSPSETKHEWQGRSDKISMLESLLNGFKESLPTHAIIEGVIELIGASGRLDIKDKVGDIVKIDYPRSLYMDVKQFRIGDNVVLDVEETVILNHTTGEERSRFKLLNLNWQN